MHFEVIGVNLTSEEQQSKSRPEKSEDRMLHPGFGLVGAYDVASSHIPLCRVISPLRLDDCLSHFHRAGLVSQCLPEAHTTSHHIRRCRDPSIRLQQACRKMVRMIIRSIKLVEERTPLVGNDVLPPSDGASLSLSRQSVCMQLAGYHAGSTNPSCIPPK